MSKKAKKRLIIVLSSILALILVVFVAGNLYIDSILNKMNKTDEFEASEVNATELDGDVVNIALIGIDESDGTARSDVVKIISLNFDTKKISITSVQRDNLVYQPMEERYEKLNHAYWYDGAQGTLSSLNYNFDLDITQYVKFDFNSVVNIVDILGGVDITMTDAEAAQLGIGGGGTYHLNGEEALAYSRIRKIDSDYERMQRQNNVIDALLAKVGDQSATGLLSVVNDVMPYIETNVSNGSFKNYATSYLTFDKSLNQYQFPSGGYSSILASLSLYGYGPHYVLNDFAGEVKLMHDNIYGGDYTVSENVLKVDRETKEMAGY
ncbi:LCP family protein [Breznakia pachnodae]|uniref:LCP family protein required for cell wall assembly n=1 Tax=Breznakia pachnodae TaxID=265178 RepID=A0ABU0DYT5_9FIRM|nr:LCP family protein [Breznakia pachnodae]MDQ0359807.1 LCP family protein required for cell wall assembly [Breznakia pachnodae]